MRLSIRKQCDAWHADSSLATCSVAVDHDLSLMPLAEYNCTVIVPVRCYQALRDIETDLRRTFPDHPAFHVDAAGAGLIPSLRRVLLAYSKRNPSVGECYAPMLPVVACLRHYI
jgi:hypothetical protein